MRVFLLVVAALMAAGRARAQTPPATQKPAAPQQPAPVASTPSATQMTVSGTLLPYSGDLYTVLTPFQSEFDPLTTVIGERSAFKSSTGAEIRFFMPVLNVPFRLIFAANPSRGGVLDNNLQPEKKWKFRFAVGSAF